LLAIRWVRFDVLPTIIDTDLHYHTGDIIQGMVVRHAPYGAWIEIDETTEGLLLIVNMTDEDRSLSESDFPPIGSSVSAIIVHSTIADGRPKVTLSTRESDMASSTDHSGS